MITFVSPPGLAKRSKEPAMLAVVVVVSLGRHATPLSTDQAVCKSHFASADGEMESVARAAAPERVGRTTAVHCLRYGTQYCTPYPPVPHHGYLVPVVEKYSAVRDWSPPQCGTILV